MERCAPRFSCASLRTPPTYSAGARMVPRMKGSSMASILDSSGSFAGLSISATVESLSRTRKITVGAVMMSVRSYSRSSLSRMISMCRSPRNPAPEAEPQSDRGFRLVGEGRIVEPELLQRRPQVLILGAVRRIQAAVDHRLRLPEALNGLARGVFASVMVSPTRVSLTSRIEADRMPTSPGPISSLLISRGVNAPRLSTWYSLPVAMKRTPSPLRMVSLEHAKQRDGALVGIIPGIYHEPPAGRLPALRPEAESAPRSPRGARPRPPPASRSPSGTPPRRCR